MKQKILLLLLGTMLWLPAMAFEYEYEGQTLKYTVLDEDAKTCEVGYKRVSGSVIIPSVAIDNDVEYTVTSIGGGAFDVCSGLTSVEIPNSVTSIRYTPIGGSGARGSVVLPKGVN
ncbi:MAG: leucine-rich repeat domain-containing protein, partial [Muribaculaceae bacterium]|nr:leucine-rich repeat domain-containing protein [Muribaculaceae bacterium]